MIDMPDLPPQFAQVIVAQASPAQKGDTRSDRAIGVCQLIRNPPIPPNTAENGISPIASTSDYFGRVEGRKVGIEGKATVVQGPEHGALKDLGSGDYMYVPNGNHLGPDRATLLVAIGTLKVRVVYFFTVQPGPLGGTEGYDPYKDKKNCPRGMFWKISLQDLKTRALK